MKALATALMVLMFGTIVSAKEAKVTCDIQSLSDAELCMEMVANARPDYEEPNDGFATDKTDRLVRALTLLGMSAETLQKAEQADYAGIMVEHGDEHHIYYFAMKKGQNVEPVELYDLNIVDMEYVLDKPYSKEALDANTYFLGLDGATIDAFTDLEERLDDLRQDK